MNKYKFYIVLVHHIQELEIKQVRLILLSSLMDNSGVFNTRMHYNTEQLPSHLIRVG